ncbi:MAG: glycosyltransferase family 2 protein, partial [Calditrichaceae bacterium]
MLISIVIPVHNEAENIGDLLEEITRLPSVHSYYTIVVDDASSDGTPEILNRKKKEMPNLEIISHSEQCGQSAALVTGIKSAAGDVVATMDGDGQNDPEDIPKLLDALLRNKSCHMAVGYRKKRKDTAWRIFSSRVANTVRS